MSAEQATGGAVGFDLMAFFKQFYPADWENRSKYEYEFLLGGMWRCRSEPYVSNVFPAIVCADDFMVSVQGHCGAYSRPRDDFADTYFQVECGFPSAREELLMPYIDGDETTDPTQTVYGYVPVSVVMDVIAKHGGFKRAATRDDHVVPSPLVAEYLSSVSETAPLQDSTNGTSDAAPNASSGISRASLEAP